MKFSHYFIYYLHWINDEIYTPLIGKLEMQTYRHHLEWAMNWNNSDKKNDKTA